MKLSINSNPNPTSPEVKNFLELLDFTVERDRLLAEHAWVTFEEKEDTMYFFSSSLPLVVNYDPSVAKSAIVSADQKLLIRSRIANKDKVSPEKGETVLSLSANDIVCTYSFTVESQKGLMQWIDEKGTIDPKLYITIDEKIGQILLPELSANRSLITHNSLGQYFIDNVSIASYIYSQSFDFNVAHIRARFDMLLFIGWNTDKNVQPAIFGVSGGVADYTNQSKDEYMTDLAIRLESLPSTALAFIDSNVKSLPESVPPPEGFTPPPPPPRDLSHRDSTIVDPPENE